jgi:hypothetical protein
MRLAFSVPRSFVIAMLGSRRQGFSSTIATERLFTLRLRGRIYWGWERRSTAGRLLARSTRLFADYVACLCDSQRKG